MHADTSHARPPRLNIGFPDNNKDLPPPPPPKSPRHDAFSPDSYEARPTPSYSSNNSPLLTVGSFHSSHAIVSDNAFSRPATASPPPEVEQKKYIPYSAEIYELPAMEEPAPVVPPISTPISAVSASPVLNSIPKRVPVRKPVPTSNPAVEPPKAQFEADIKASQNEPEGLSAHKTQPSTTNSAELPLAVQDKDGGTEDRILSSTVEDQDLPPPPPSKDPDVLPVATKQAPNESSLLKRRNPSVQLSTLEVVQPPDHRDDDRLETLSSAVYTPPTRTPRSAKQSKATTPLLESHAQSSALAGSESARGVSIVSISSEPGRPSDSVAARSQTIDASHSSDVANRPAPNRSSTSDKDKLLIKARTSNTRPSSHEVAGAAGSSDIVSDLKKPLPPSKPESHILPAKAKPTVLDTPRTLSDDSPAASDIVQQRKPNDRSAKPDKRGQQQDLNSESRKKNGPEAARVTTDIQRNAAATNGPARFRAISPDDVHRRGPAIDSMSRALSPDHGQRRARPPMADSINRGFDSARGPPRSHPARARPNERPMSPEEYHQRARTNRPGPGMRPMSPDDPARWVRPPHPHPNGRPMSPADEPGRRRPMGPDPRMINDRRGPHAQDRIRDGPRRAMSPEQAQPVFHGRTAEPEVPAERMGSSEATNATAESRKQFMQLVQRSTALHERYDALRTERQRLATAISTTLRDSKATQELIDSLANQHLALNTVNSSIDICLAKLKAIDCRKEEVVSRALLAVATPNRSRDGSPAVFAETTQRPSSVPISTSVNNTKPQTAGMDIDNKATKSATKATATSISELNAQKETDRSHSAVEKNTVLLNGKSHSSLPAETRGASTVGTSRASNPPKLKIDSAIVSMDKPSPLKSGSATKDGKTPDEKSGQLYADHDIFDSYYDESDQ